MVLREEWRTVPGFIAYEVTESGRVREKFDMRVLDSSDGTVALWRGGKRYHRSINKLVREAFKQRENPVLAVEGFRAIPDFPGYSINRSGDIYNERTRRFLEHGHTVQLQVDGVRHHKTVSTLINRTFSR